jgi:DNA polymerase III subunit gamma/tau
MKYKAKGEFKNTYRPRDIKYVVGHDTTKKFLINSVNKGMLPQILMFYGEKGLGKTTLARIIAAGLNCEQGVSLSPCGVCDNCRSVFSGSSPDYKEVNVGAKTGVDNVRSLIETLRFSPMYLTNKIYVLDECHKLSDAGQNALLKELEDTPENIYMIFCTTSKENLIPTLLDRCYDFYFEKLTEKELGEMVKDILDIEGGSLDKDIIHALVETADGSARKLVVNLQKILLSDIKTIKEAAEILGTEIVMQHDIKHLSKAIMAQDSKISFNIINRYSYSDCDLARKSLINYFGSILLRVGKSNYKEAMKISYIIDVLSSNISNPAKGLFVNDIFKITKVSEKRYV